MKFDEIRFGDIGRLLFGDVPPSFFIEVVIRVAIIYLIIVVSVRFMGKRMTSMISRGELAAMVSLAGAVGVPLQAPDRGLLPVMVVAVVIVFFERIVSWMASRDQRLERVTSGNIATLVQDGVLNLKSMARVNVSKSRLFAQLRSEGITHLGVVQRYYMEANGTFSIKTQDGQKPGLCIIPEWDQELFEELCTKDDQRVCGECGQLESREDTCESCGKGRWTHAVC